MKWKEFLEIEDCDLCPIKEAELCGGGASCYGGSPIDPLTIIGKAVRGDG